MKSILFDDFRAVGFTQIPPQPIDIIMCSPPSEIPPEQGYAGKLVDMNSFDFMNSFAEHCKRLLDRAGVVIVEKMDNWREGYLQDWSNLICDSFYRNGFYLRNRLWWQTQYKRNRHGSTVRTINVFSKSDIGKPPQWRDIIAAPRPKINGCLIGTATKVFRELLQWYYIDRQCHDCLYLPFLGTGGAMEAAIELGIDNVFGVEIDINMMPFIQARLGDSYNSINIITNRENQ